MIASSVVTWSIFSIIAALGAIAMATLYVLEARGKRRASKLAWYRRRVLPLIALAVIASLRAFVVNG